MRGGNSWNLGTKEIPGKENSEGVCRRHPSGNMIIGIVVRKYFCYVPKLGLRNEKNRGLGLRN